MPRVVFELTTLVFERAKTVYASDRAATVIGHKNSTNWHSSLKELRKITKTSASTAVLWREI
jgi:hypothetical protein